MYSLKNLKTFLTTWTLPFLVSYMKKIINMNIMKIDLSVVQAAFQNVFKNIQHT